MRKLSLSYADFFANSQDVPSFDTLLMKCIAIKGSLDLLLGEQGVSICVSEMSSEKGQFSGRWRLPVLADKDRNAGAAILAPFYFRIEQLELPHHAIYSIGRPYRSIADFFMRNYFIGVCRGKVFDFNTIDAQANPKTSEKSHELSRRYLWMLEKSFNEPVWRKPNPHRLLILNAYLPMFKFKNILLEEGAIEYRNDTTQNNNCEGRGGQKKCLMLVRNKIMSHHSN